MLDYKVDTPFYDPIKSYEENYDKGPFGAFADTHVYKTKGQPSYSIFGQKVYLPFGIPAGPLLNGRYVKAALDKGFDLVTYKTVRSHIHPSNQWPNVLGIKVDGDLTLDKAERGVLGTQEYKSPLAITNSFGVPSYSPTFWQSDLTEAVKYAGKGQLVIGSFQGTIIPSDNTKGYINDFVDTARMVKQTGVKVLEANLSCPNEGSSHLLCFDIPRTKEIVEEIRKVIGNTPLVIKIAYFEEKAQLHKLIEEIGKVVDGISAINTIPAKVIDAQGKQALPGDPGRLIAGVCGTPIKWAGIEMVRELKKLRKELGFSYTIFGVGGVTQPEDYQEYRDAGADVVMSATGAMWNPYLAPEIKEKYL